MTTNKSAKMYFDGGCYPNPGTMDIALIFTGHYTENFYQELYQGTNNLAEWYAVFAGLEIALTQNIDHLHVVGDSELVIKQLNGEYRVKNKNLKPLFEKCDSLKSKFKTIKFEHISRDFNLAGIHIEQMRQKNA